MPAPVKVVVLGGLVMDLIYEVPEWPVLRKAVQATSFVMQPGGKGLNQAVAAARLGAQVTVISAIGQDYLGDLLLAELERESVNYDPVERQPAVDTDATCVIIEKGEPGFIGGKLAGNTVDYSLISKASSYIKSADVVMATGEVPVDAVQEAFKIAKEHGIITVFNPAPPEKLGKAVLSLTDYLIPNDWESSVLVGVRRAGGGFSLEEIARRLRRNGANNVIITGGAYHGLYLIGPDSGTFEAFEVDIVDTTGASDAFCAALAVSLAQGKDIDAAIVIASAAGALACTKFGASTSMPERSALNAFLALKKVSHKLN